MDSILKSTKLLNRRSWIYFRLYKDPASNNDWKHTLDWYHETLINVVRPVVNANSNIMAIFFGLYGPEGHVIEEEIYEKNIEEPNANLTFIRLRVAAKTGKKADVKNAFLAIIRNHRNLVWDYETMITFNVNGDLGPRFGSNNSPQTLRFIRYWDAGCRYILSILSMPGNWIRDVDVWGVPHLINNSIGASLRPERNPIICQNCQAHMYMKTSLDAANLPAPIQHIQVPVFVFFCPNCGNQSLISSNI